MSREADTAKERRTKIERAGMSYAAQVERRHNSRVLECRHASLPFLPKRSADTTTLRPCRLSSNRWNSQRAESSRNEPLVNCGGLNRQRTMCFLYPCQHDTSNYEKLQRHNDKQKSQNNGKATLARRLPEKDTPFDTIRAFRVGYVIIRSSEHAI